MRIALFATCLADVMFPDVAIATVTLLERLGHEVVFPADQVCCGQMHVNTGYFDAATPVVRNHVTVFSEADYDVAVGPSASCVGSVRHQHEMIARRTGDAEFTARATAVAERTYELSELLVDVLGVTDVGAYFPHRVTYHPTCHSLRLLRVGDKPVQPAPRGRGHRPGRTPRLGLLLRFRWHLRAEEPRRLHRDARRQDDRGAVHPRRGVLLR